MVSAVSLAAQGIAILAGLGLLGLVLTAQAGLILQMLINRMLSRRVAAGRISRSANDDVSRKLLSKAMWQAPWRTAVGSVMRSEAHTAELQAQMSNSYTVFCLKK